MSDKINLGESIQPPQTVLTEMLAVMQDLFNHNKTFQLLDPPDVLARILNEPKSGNEIRKFVASYLNPHHPEPYAQAEKGMCVMAILGYMFARGEARTKGRIGL